MARLGKISDYIDRVLDIASQSPRARALSQSLTRRYADTLQSQTSVARLKILAGLYPPTPNGRPLEHRYYWSDGSGPHKFASRKSQAYFFSRVLPSGQVPYRRTGNLGESITASIDGVDTIRYNIDLGKAPYAPFVVGNANAQYYYHTRTGWPQLQDVIGLAYRDGQVLNELGNVVQGVYSAFINEGKI